MFLHFELGIAVLIANFLDIEEFMDAVSFDDHDKDPAFRIHGLQPGDEFPNFHSAPSWRLSYGVGFLRCVPITIAYRALQDRDRCPITGREPDRGKDSLRTVGIIGRAIGEAPEWCVRGPSIRI
jgi:hypothetical protein